MALSNVALTDTFDTWRTRTNQLVVFTEQIDTNLSSIGVSANGYTNSIAVSGNSYATQVGTSGNAYATAIGIAGNTYANAVGTAGNTYTLAAFNKANSTTYTANLVISVADNTNAALRITQTGTGPALRVEDEANPDSTPFIIDASGNVGIGTTSPTDHLTVVGTTPTIRMKDGVNSGFYLQQGSGSAFVWNQDNFSMAFGTNNTERMRIDATGNVLIGRTSSNIGSNVKLDIVGAVNASAVLVNGSALESGISTGRAIAMTIVFG